jgi:hypothetical protein
VTHPDIGRIEIPQRSGLCYRGMLPLGWSRR